MDMLVKLYDLPPLEPHRQRQTAQGITIRRGIAPEKHVVLAWIRQHFSEFWVSEADVAYSRQPISCFVATKDEQMIGFACYDTTRRGFFGPTGVDETERGQGVGTALLLATLHDMWAQGYGYGIIGWVGPADYYARTVGATLIEDSAPGVYRGMLRE